MVAKMLTILQKKYHKRGRKIRIWGETITTAPFWFKTMLYTDDSVAMDSEKDLSKTKRGNFEDF